MNRDNRIERILKLIYYLLGLSTAGFVFVISKLSSLEYDLVNYFLIFSLVTLGLSISILFVLISITIVSDDESWNKKIKIKNLRRIVGLLGFLIGMTVFSIISWILLFKGYLNISF